MSTQPPISGNPTFPPVTGPNNTPDTNVDLDDPGSDAISPASQLDLPGTSTRSPIKPKTISLFRPHGVRTPRPHAAKPYSRPVPKLSKCPRFCFYDPLLMNYPELSHFVPTRLAGVRVSAQSATPRASKPGSTLPTPTEASGPVTSTAYEEYIDIALIQRSIGRMMSETDDTEFSTDEQQNTAENLVPMLYTHDKNPWFRLRKNPQPLPSIGPYTANPVCWFFL